MEGIGSDTESQQSPEQSSLTLTPGTESLVNLWQQTGNFPYPELQVFPAPLAHELSRTELTLIHHLSTISNDLLLKGTSHLTTWTQKMPNPPAYTELSLADVIMKVPEHSVIISVRDARAPLILCEPSGMGTFVYGNTKSTSTSR
ncbi:hypothetical protein LTR86_006300 [Recurvomyces mirabilis]|nr:hypothetical protein LTR86_006300 [Recurvomyces mirabilis]